MLKRQIRQLSFKRVKQNSKTILKLLFVLGGGTVSLLMLNEFFEERYHLKNKQIPSKSIYYTENNTSICKIEDNGKPTILILGTGWGVFLKSWILGCFDFERIR